ncbi:MAG: hypothetical protein QW461_10800 [Candidatus Jordarchaeales archaeon]
MEKTGKLQLEPREQAQEQELLELAAKKRRPRFRQVVWLDLDVFMKVADMASKLGVAENVLIAEIVRRYLEKNTEPIKVIKETVPMPAGFYCPLCIRRFVRPSELLEHLRSSECKEKLKGEIGW